MSTLIGFALKEEAAPFSENCDAQDFSL